MRWPRQTAPAWPVHVGVFVVACVAGIAYVLADANLRPVIFTLVTRR
jgi:diguanylate cyclase